MSKEEHNDNPTYRVPTSREPEYKAPKQWSGQSLKSSSDGPIGAGISLIVGLSPRAGDPTGGRAPGPVRLPNPNGKRK
jgi:hypothetical protein